MFLRHGLLVHGVPVLVWVECQTDGTEEMSLRPL